MRRTLFLTGWLWLTLGWLQAQDISGSWYGLLEVSGTSLTLVFNLQAVDSGYTATLDSPDQGARGIPVTAVKWHDSTLALSVQPLGIHYSGSMVTPDSLAGTFTQRGLVLPLSLSRHKPVKKKPPRPQEPKPPWPYRTEEIRFFNPHDSIMLAGTLTLPATEGPFPAIVLISGSGPQNRNEEIAGHKPFLVLADHLTRQGFAVLRYDDRGTAASGGTFVRSLTTDFARDAAAALDYLHTRSDINPQQTGLLGHSEGGLVAIMLAAQRPDVAFLVLLAAPAVPGDQLLLAQQGAIYRQSGMSEAAWQQIRAFNKGAFELVKTTPDSARLSSKLYEYFITQLDSNPLLNMSGMPAEEFVSLQIRQLTNPWMTAFIRYDPRPDLARVKCPVLALNGSRDLQVPAVQNLTVIKQVLEENGNSKVVIKELPGLNHLMQHAETGLPTEYSQIDETIAPQVLEIIAEWLRKTVKE